MKENKKVLRVTAIILLLQAPTLWGSEELRWTSIARSLSTANFGIAYNFPDELNARQSAYEECQSKAYKERDCVVFYTSSKAGFYAYADGQDLKGAVAFTPESKEKAIEAATKKCSEVSTNCEWRYWWSNQIVVTEQ